MRQNKIAQWSALAAFILSMFFTSLMYADTMICFGSLNMTLQGNGENAFGDKSDLESADYTTGRFSSQETAAGGPVIDCPTGHVEVDTDPGKCTATTNLYFPDFENEDCSLSGTVVTTVVTEPAGLYYADLPVGQYEVTFTAFDTCGNASLPCHATIEVIDNEIPAAVCQGTKVVALNNNGHAGVFAHDFDDGSHDNCSPNSSLEFEVSRDGIEFSALVEFDCDDISPAEPIIVYMRVSEPGSGLSNICKTIVEVQDNYPILLTCPGPQEVGCEDDLSDLSIFGEPTVVTTCGFTVTETSTVNLTSCGSGTIIRSFTVIGSGGGTASCNQEITVINQAPFDGSTIEWPENYTVTDACIQPDDLKPENLPISPINYSKPIVNSGSCAMIAWNYSDQLFYVAFPSCYKIVRTWKVMDWCQYSVDNPSEGMWTHQQMIIVMDSEPPVITFCPPNITVGVDNNCVQAFVNLLPVEATDCSPSLTYTNDSPYNGANASGIYPLGTHTVKFTVKDGCGNQSTCTTQITVTDLKKPTPYAYNGIVAELQEMGGQIMTSVSASQLNYNSFDNCTPKSELVLAIRLEGDTEPPGSSISFGCSGKGEHNVELWVTDAAGNSDYCITTIIVQDNMLLCPDTLVSGNIIVTGAIKTEEGEQLPSVKITLPNMGMVNETDDSGIFAITGLQAGENYVVSPEKNSEALNGVTTFDLVLMSRHVLGVGALDSPYKIIAADINRSGSVTTADIVELRKLVLQIYQEFPNNTSWRFVKKDYVFPDPANPFSQTFPETLIANNVNQDLIDADFVGIKIGDLNGSAVTNYGGGNVGDRSGIEQLLIQSEDREVKAGDEIVVPLQLQNHLALLALQFTLEFETGYLELEGIEEGALPANVEECFGQSLLDEGALTVAWYQTRPLALNAGESIFNLRFRVKEDGRLSEMIALTSKFTQAAIYDATESLLNPHLEFTNPDNMQTNSFQLYQNQPNPFKRSTNIGFNLPESGWAKLTIYDLSGKVLKTLDRHFEEGYNRVTIEGDELPSGGVLFYQLETSGNRATRKMALIQ